jgi:hypothetical protein
LSFGNRKSTTFASAIVTRLRPYIGGDPGLQVLVRMDVLDLNDPAGINPVNPVDRMGTLRGRINVPDTRDGFKGFFDCGDIKDSVG